MKFFPWFESLTKSPINHPGGRRRPIGPRLRLEPLEQRQLLSVNTALLWDLNPGSIGSSPEEFVQVGENVFFVADDGINGVELWKSDAAGTEMVKDIFPGGGTNPNSSSPANLTNVGGTLFFTANDGLNGTELWTSDGTESGTVMVTDLLPGSSDQYGSLLPSSSNPQDLTDVDGTLYFAAYETDHGAELFKSDGSESGTVLVKDIFPGSTSVENYGDFPNSSAPRNFAAVDGTLYFTANDGTHGEELWKSDGTESGTVMVKDLFPEDGSDPPNSSYPQYLTNVDGTLYFAADDGEKGRELWKSDGTESGTVMVKDLFPGGSYEYNYGYYPNSSSPQNLTSFDGTLYFTAYDSLNGAELWKSDGTNFGTLMIKDLFPGGSYPNSSTPKELTVAGGRLFFTAGDDTHGRELWTTDGTAVGTVLVEDINTQDTGGPTADSTPANLTSVGGVLHFTADDGINGRELWMSDATALGTFMVGDLFPGSDPSDPLALKDIGGVLYFSADDGSSGREPWTHQPITTEDYGSLGGIAFEDLNGSGARDAGEPGIVGVTIYLDANSSWKFDEGELSTVTDSEGSYSFTLPPGRYEVRQLVPGIMLQTFPVTLEEDALSHVVSLGLGSQLDGWDFGSYTLVAPNQVDLLPVSDTGTANDDNITNLDNSSPETAWELHVSGVSDVGFFITFIDGVRVGHGKSVGGSLTITTYGNALLADGTHSVTVEQRLATEKSELSEPLIVTVDTIAPAAINSPALVLVRVDKPYQYDVNSPDEGSPGITYLLAEAPDNASIDETGVIVWTPTESQLGIQPFEIRVIDAAGNYSAQSFDVTVIDAVPAYPDSYTAQEDQKLEIDAVFGVLANDGENNPNPLTATLLTSPTHGTVDLLADGSFDYTPDADFFGTDTFTYKANDGIHDSNEAPVTITVESVNDPPVAVDDAYSVPEDDALLRNAAWGVLINDLDNDSTSLVALLVDLPEHGSLSLSADGSFVYTPVANFFGTDSFTYQANDGALDSDLATVTIDVEEFNDRPIVANDSFDVDENDTLTVNVAQGVLVNDSDAEDDPITAAVNTLPANGTLILNADGSFTYTPDADFAGIDTFSYRASDGPNESTPATVTINVHAQSDPPSAGNDQFQFAQNSGLHVLEVLTNDSADPGGSQSLQISVVTQGSAGGVVTIGTGGTTLQYTPATDYVGIETFTYTIKDTSGLTDQATVVITVTEVISDSSISGIVYCDSNVSGSYEASELRIPGTVITLTGVDDQGRTVNLSVMTGSDGAYSFDELRPGTYQVAETQPTAMLDGEDSIGTLGGTVTNDRFSSIVLTGDSHGTGYNFGERGLRPEFISLRFFLASTPPPEDYLPEVVADAEEKAGNYELAAAIRQGATEVPDPSDPAPVALDDTYTVAEDGILDVDAGDGVLSNDFDAGGTSDPLTAVLLSGPTDGTLTLQGDGSFAYTPDADFDGTDSFTYQATNDDGTSNAATVTINVTPTDSPVSFATIENVTLSAGSPLLIPLDGQTSDGQALSFTASSSNPSLVTPSIPNDNRSMRISVAGYGDMVLQLHEDLVPRVTDHIIELAEDGFYDGAIFHRVIDDFMIQGGNAIYGGGDPTDVEDFDDQFHVDLQHNTPGVVSMAKAGDDTNGSQFFINEVPTRYLDYNHSVFGLLVEGEDVREAISNVATGASDRPTTDVVMEAVDIFFDEENNVLMLKAPEGATGEADVTVIVTGEDSQTYQQTFHVTVQPDTSNGGPFLDPIPTIQTTVDTPATFQLTANDVEGDPVSFSVVSRGSTGYTYDVNDQTGLVTVTPPSGFTGTMEILVRVRPETSSNTSDTYDTQVVLIEVG